MSVQDHIYQPDMYSIACVRCGYIQDLGDKPYKVDLEAQGWTERVEVDEQYEDSNDDIDEENDENSDDEYGAICPSCNGVETSATSDSDEASESTENECQLLVDTLDNLYALTLSLHLQQVTSDHKLDKCRICQSLAGTNTLLISYGKGHS